MNKSMNKQKHYVPSIEAIKEALENAHIVYHNNTKERVDFDLFGELCVTNTHTSDTIKLTNEHISSCFYLK